MLLVSWAGLVALDYFGDRDTTYDLGVVGASAGATDGIKTALGEGYELTTKEYGDRAAAEAAITAGDVDAAVVVDDHAWTLVGDNEVDAPLETAVRSSVAAEAVARNAAAQDVDLEALNAGADVSVDLLDADSEDLGQRKLVAFGLSMLFYLVALLFGMQIAQSVVAEKESRVVEILAAAIPTRALLWGKIAGNTLLALGQVVIVVGGGLVDLRGARQRHPAVRRRAGDGVVHRVLRARLHRAGSAVVGGRRPVVAGAGHRVDHDAPADRAARRLSGRRHRRGQGARHRLAGAGHLRDRDAGAAGLRRRAPCGRSCSRWGSTWWRRCCSSDWVPGSTTTT